MTNNPWLVKDISAFLAYKCPECSFLHSENAAFEEHAVSLHPASSVFFKPLDQTQEPFQSVIIKQEISEDPESRHLTDDSDPIENNDPIKVNTEPIESKNIKQEPLERLDLDDIKFQTFWNVFESLYKCPFPACEQKSKSASIMKKHVSIAHCPEDPNGERPKVIKCNKCPYTYITEAAFPNHCKHNHPPEPKDQVDPSSNTLEPVAKRTKLTYKVSSQSRHHCNRCQVPMKSNQTWMTELDIKEVIESNKELLCQHCTIPQDLALFCHPCGIQFIQEKDLNNHKLKHKMSDQLNKSFKCIQCIFQCNTKEAMTQHLANHSSKMHCSLCNVKVEMLNMNQHYKQHHAERTNLICCSRNFESYSELLKHLKTTDCSTMNEDKTYLCPICKKRFKGSRELCLRHFLSRYSCVKCQKCLQTKSELSIHLQSNAPCLFIGLQPLAFGSVDSRNLWKN